MYHFSALQINACLYCKYSWKNFSLLKNWWDILENKYQNTTQNLTSVSSPFILYDSSKQHLNCTSTCYWNASKSLFFRFQTLSYFSISPHWDFSVVTSRFWKVSWVNAHDSNNLRSVLWFSYFTCTRISAFYLSLIHAPLHFQLPVICLALTSQRFSTDRASEVMAVSRYDLPRWTKEESSKGSSSVFSGQF